MACRFWWLITFSLAWLQNVHLVAKWLTTLEKKLEQYSLESHADYRVFISAEPAGTRDSHIIPGGILEMSIKITNEPPTGMFANLHKALDNFSQVTCHLLNHTSYCFHFHFNVVIDWMTLGLTYKPWHLNSPSMRPIVLACIWWPRHSPNRPDTHSVGPVCTKWP